MDYPTELQKKMDRAAFEDAVWLKAADLARQDGYADEDKIAKFLKDFKSDESGIVTKGEK